MTKETQTTPGAYESDGHLKLHKDGSTEWIEAETTPYPKWICSDCGDKHGRRPCGIATWHEGVCDICKEAAIVTEPRDYGHLKDGWNK